MRRRPYALLCLALGVAGCAPQVAQNAPDLKLASVELASGAPEAALHSAQAVLAVSPRDARAWSIVGDAQAALGEVSLARSSYAKARSADPIAVAAELGLVRLTLQDNPKSAEAELQHMLVSAPHDPRIWTDLGVAYDLQGSAAQAQQAYRQALAENPAMVSAQVNLGLSLALSGRPGAGLKLLAPLASGVDATPRTRADLGVALALANGAQAARQVLGQDATPQDTQTALDRLAAMGDAARR
jgi:Flp pilus assembly protein TadD